MYDAGFGEMYDVVMASTKDEAMEIAYEEWKREVEDNASYAVIGEATDELKEEYGV